MRCEIYLIRHGTTRDNSRGIFSGWRNVGLTIKGRRDAKIVALRLKNKKIGIAFHSDLKRSYQTLKTVLSFHPECKEVICDPRIKERDYGSLSGKNHLEIVKNFGVEKYDSWHRGYDSRPPNGESLKDVEVRVLNFIKDLIKLVKQRRVNIVISAHGNSMRALRKYFEKLTPKEMCTIYNDFESVYAYSLEV